MGQRLLNDQVVAQVREVFSAQLQQPVEVMFFGDQAGCEYCEDTLSLMREVTELSDKLHLSIYDIRDNADLASQYHVDKTPGLVLAARDGELVTDYGVRFAGVPAGHEFSSLIYDLIQVSGRDSGLSEQTRQELSKLTQPVLLQVFVTPT